MDSVASSIPAPCLPRIENPGIPTKPPGRRQHVGPDIGSPPDTKSTVAAFLRLPGHHSRSDFPPGPLVPHSPCVAP